MKSKSEIKQIHNDLEAALQSVMEKHNLSGSDSRITYGETGFKFAMQFGFKDVIGEDADPKYLQGLQRYGRLYELSVADIGQEFTLGDTAYVLKGMISKVNAIVERVSDKKLWKMTASVVSRQLKLTHQTKLARAK